MMTVPDYNTTISWQL